MIYKKIKDMTANMLRTKKLFTTFMILLVVKLIWILMWAAAAQFSFYTDGMVTFFRWTMAAIAIAILWNGVKLIISLFKTQKEIMSNINTAINTMSDKEKLDKLKTLNQMLNKTWKNL